MGLCKCPKRKVTNLFCFEHRVNVCEHCLVENHAKCVVQSYLNWLKDSDYNPDCQLCNKPLVNGNVVRLLCYDVFHESCLDRHFRKLPTNTAPAGYKCFKCDIPIFPSPNQAGKVVEQLQNCLTKYNWARMGLGLPLIEESDIVESEIENQADELEFSNLSSLNDSRNNELEPLHGSTMIKQILDSSLDEGSWLKKSIYSKFSTPEKNSNSTVIEMNEITTSGKLSDEMGAVSRKLMGSTANELPESLRKTVSGQDTDAEDKYKRRSAFSWLSRWIRSRMLRGRGRGYHDMTVMPKRIAIIILIGVIALFTIIVFATQVGRKRAEQDPFLDPMANPNIHVVGDADIANHVNDELVKLRRHHPPGVLPDNENHKL